MLITLIRRLAALELQKDTFSVITAQFLLSAFAMHLGTPGLFNVSVNRLIC